MRIVYCECGSSQQFHSILTVVQVQWVESNSVVGMPMSIAKSYSSRIMWAFVCGCFLRLTLNDVSSKVHILVSHLCSICTVGISSFLHPEPRAIIMHSSSDLRWIMFHVYENVPVIPEEAQKIWIVSRSAVDVRNEATFLAKVASNTICIKIQSNEATTNKKCSHIYLNRKGS
jgi:hypothetical protein